MPNYNLSTRGRIADINIGMRVDRATANMTTGLDLFTISGGTVLVTLILGEVTTIMETKTINLKLQADPTTGTTSDMSANVDMTAAEAGTLITISGVPGTATQLGKSGNVIGQLAPVVVAPGVIQVIIGATHTGSIKWSVFYVPLEEGASIAAA